MSRTKRKLMPYLYHEQVLDDAYLKEGESLPSLQNTEPTPRQLLEVPENFSRGHMCDADSYDVEGHLASISRKKPIKSDGSKFPKKIKKTDGVGIGDFDEEK